ncbi:MAG: hypothetical protein AAFV37_04235, partial [Pseudomonadota bacterium]
TACDALDNKVPAHRQIALQSLLGEALAKLTKGILSANMSGGVSAQIDALTPYEEALRATSSEDLSAYERAVHKRRINQLARDDVPEDLAERFATSRLVAIAPLISSLSEDANCTPAEAIGAYLTVGDALSVDRLRHVAVQALLDLPHWDRLALRGLIRELELLQAETAVLALAAPSIEAWLEAVRSSRDTLIADLKKYTASKPSFAQFALATDSLRSFVKSQP